MFDFVKTKKVYITKHKINLFFYYVLFVCVFFLVPNYANAAGGGISEWLGGAASWIGNTAATPFFIFFGFLITLFGWLLGHLASLFIFLLMHFASYNDFLKEDFVSNGWILMRDFSNMFFILMLLIIAFGTILRQENFSYKKYLPKIIIMAVLINFSKTICGLAIDVSQIVMLTFVNGFNYGSSFGSGAMVKALNMDKYFSIWQGGNIGWDIIKANFQSGVTPLSVFGSLLFACILLIVALVVVTVFCVVLLVRIVTLWILIILSPLAFMLYAFPGGQQYFSKWKDQFVKQLVVGPAMAFFLWLALSAAQFNDNKGLGASLGTFTKEEEGFISGLLNGIAGDPSQMISYLVTIIFLTLGLMMAQQAGGAAAKAAGTGMGYLNKWKGWGLGVAQKRAIGAAKSVGRTSLGLADAASGGRVSNVGGRVYDWYNKGIGGVGGGWGAMWDVANKIPGLSKIDARLTRLADRRHATEAGQITDENGIVFKRGDGKSGKDTKYFYNDNGERYEDGNFEAVEGRFGRMYMNYYKSAPVRADRKREEEEQKKDIDKLKVEYDKETPALLRQLLDVEKNKDKKLAISLALAEKSGFTEKIQLDKVKSELASNQSAMNQLVEAIDKKQAHLNYDMSRDADKEAFKVKVKKGKIDVGALDGSAYGDKNLLAAVREATESVPGRFDSIISKVAENQDYRAKLEKSLDESIGDAIVKGDEKTAIALAGSMAKLNGDLEKAFAKFTDPVTKMTDYLRDASATHIGKIDANNVKGGVETALLEAMDFGKLKALNIKGDNEELVRVLAQKMVDKGGDDAKRIKSDNVLGSKVK